MKPTMEDNGTPHELLLTREIMAAIARFNSEHGNTLGPEAIRDTMLIVAALAHMEATSMGGASGGDQNFEDSFLEKARESVIKAWSASIDKSGFVQ